MTTYTKCLLGLLSCPDEKASGSEVIFVLKKEKEKTDRKKGETGDIIRTALWCFIGLPRNLCA